jgi:hypothetical protein
VALDGSGRLVVGVRGSDNGLWTSQQKSENSAAFTDFSKQSSNMTDSPTAAADAAGRVHFIYRGTDQAAWRLSQTDDYQSFTNAESLNGQILQRPTAALGWDGRLNVFVIGTDKALWVAVRTDENSEGSAQGPAALLPGLEVRRERVHGRAGASAHRGNAPGPAEGPRTAEPPYTSHSPLPGSPGMGRSTAPCPQKRTSACPVRSSGRGGAMHSFAVGAGGGHCPRARLGQEPWGWYGHCFRM